MAVTHNDPRVAKSSHDPNPYRDTPIWDLVSALKEQWANEMPADWHIVEEVMHRAIQAESPTNGSHDKDGYWVETF